MKNLHKQFSVSSKFISILLIAIINCGMVSSQWTFTNCGATGRFGPTQANCDATYGAGIVTVVTQGIQRWTVPGTGTYRIEVWGAQGGFGANAGGLGAYCRGDFTLTGGQFIQIAVGQAGTLTGGGGGSFVVDQTNTPLIIAGGGAGGGAGGPGGGGQLPGGGGGGGLGAFIGCQASGGGGFSGNGQSAGGTGGLSFLNGLVGGSGNTCGGAPFPNGGFGGGGGSGYSPDNSAGGGGYTGGNGTWVGPGTGGFSFNSGAGPINNINVQSGHGLVVITPLDIVVPFSGNNTYTTCVGTIRDHGGTGFYSNFANGYTVINPTIAGNFVRLTFTQFDTENGFDFVTIYDGVGTGGTILYGPQSGTPALPTVTSCSGSLTIRFTSDFSVTRPGFAANISCVGLPEVNVVGNGNSIVDGDVSPTLTDHTDFGNQSICSGTITRTYTIQNSGTANLTLSAPTISGGTAPGDFAVTANPASPVAPGGSTTFQVTFDPSANGLRTTNISFTNSDCNENPYDFSIQGTGVDPEVNVQGNAVSIIDGDVTPSAADHTDFGSVLTCTGTIVRTFTIQNTGTANLTVGVPTISGGTAPGDFAVTANPASPVAPGGSTTFQVTFDPSANGLRTTNISFTNSDCNENPYDFSIQGTGNADLVNPTLVGMPGNQTLNNALNLCSQTATWTAPTATDNCPGPVVSSSHAPGSSFPVGTTVVTYTATDGSGNTSTATFSITVNDVQSPNATAPTTTDLECATDLPAAQTTIAGFLGLPGASASDNCTATGSLTVTSSTGPLVGSSCGGTITRTYTITDAALNSTNVDHVFTVTDNTNPVFTSCPTNITQPAIPLNCGRVVTYPAPTATDNCSGVVITQTDGTGLTSGQIFPVGTTIQTFVATDVCGNTSSCSFTITIQDTQSPVITSCPTSFSVPASAGSCSANASWVAPTASDNCPGVILTSSHAPGAVFPVGPTVVTYTATDANSNTTTCSFTVTVNDMQPPVANCQNVTVNLDAAGNGSTTAAAVNNGSTDNCGITLMTLTPNTFTCANVGANTVTLTVSDAAGNTSTCTATVTVVDNIPPVATCQNVNVFLDGSGNGSTTAAAVNNGSSDACGIASLSLSQTTFTCANLGGNPVTLTVTDVNGNTSTCNAMVTVIDNILPTISCPATANLTTDPGMCTSSGSIGTATTTDNCSSTVSVDNPGPYGLGATTVTWTATDLSGNTITCTQTVNVADMEVPAISCPGPVSVNTNPGSCFATAVPLGTATATDNCTVSPTISNDAPASYPVGNTTVTWTATDASGNSSTCTQVVTVTDNELPTITCPLTANLNTDPGLCTSSGSIGIATTTDNCSSTVAVSNPGPYNLGTTVVTWTATDASGNTNTCTQTINVADNELPVISCPGPVTVNTDGGTCSATGVTLGTATATDNCTASPTITSDAPGTFGLGSTTVTWTATDASGNSATCTQVVTVTDNEFPTITCPANVVGNNDPGFCYATNGAGCITVNGFQNEYDPIEWTESLINSNGFVATGGAPSVISIISSDGMPFGGDGYTNYSIPITCDGNISFDWTYNTSDGAPWDYPVYSTNGGLSYNFFPGYNTGGGTFQTGSANIPVLTGQTFVLAMYTVDNIFGAGVVDVTNFSGPAANGVSVGTPVTNDNCSIFSITSDAPATFPVGTTTVTWSVTDGSNNTTTCTQLVTINDTEAPVITCPGDVSFTADAGSCSSSTVVLGMATATDNCGIATITNNGVGPYPVGNTNVIWTATDIHGNTSTCVQIVTVTDDEDPTISCPSNITVDNDPGICGAVVSFVAPTASDNCTFSVAQTAGLPSGSTFPEGTTTNTFVVTDASGNTASCSFTVTVNDTEAPVLVGCPTDITVSNDLNNCSAVVTFADPTATDNCGGVGNFSLIQNTDLTIENGLSCGGGSTWHARYYDLATYGVSGNFDVDNIEFGVLGVNNPGGDPITLNIYAVPTFSGSAGALPAPIYTSVITVPVSAIGTLHNVSLPPGVTIPAGLNLLYTLTVNGAIAYPWLVAYNDASPAPSAFETDPGYIGGTCIGSPDYFTLASIGFPEWAPIMSAFGHSITSSTTVAQTAGPASGSAFPVGNTLVEYTATDGSGNTSTCTFTVTVQDTEAPTITCPATVNTFTNTACTATGVALGAPTTGDNCGVATVTNDAPAAFPLGSTTVTWTVTDIHGNTNTCTQIVNVADNVAPVPDVAVLPIETGLCSVTITTFPTATDNCSGVLTGTTPITTFTSGGTYTIVWTYTDGAGNTTTQTQTVQVNSPEADILGNGNPINHMSSAYSLTNHTDFGVVPTCGGTLTRTFTIQNNGIGNLNLTGTSLILITGLHASQFTVTSMPAPVVPPGGSTTFSVTFNPNGAGYRYARISVFNNDCNEGNYYFMVRGQGSGIDNVGPVPDVASLPPVTGSCNATVVTVPTATDACEGPVTATTTSPLTYTSQGTYTVVWTYSDGNLNTVTQTQTVIVQDVTPPTAVCQNTVVELDGSGNGILYASAIDGGSTDNCGALTYIGIQGAVKVVNGTFNSNLMSWSPANGAMYQSTGGNPAGMAWLNGSGSLGTDPSIQQTLYDLVPGQMYVIRGHYRSVTGIGSTPGQIAFGIDLDGVQIATRPLPNPITTWTPFNVTFTATANTHVVRFRGEINGTDGDIALDNISVDGTAKRFNCYTLGVYPATLVVTDANGNSSTCTANATIQATLFPCPFTFNDDAPEVEQISDVNESGESGNLGVDAMDTDGMSVDIYPNPSDGNFTVRVNNMSEDETEIRIMDALGKMVYATKLTSNLMTYDMSYLRAGTYYVQIVTQRSTITKQIIITQKY